MLESVKKWWAAHKRRTLWAAPIFWQLFYSALALWFGIAPHFGAIFRETRLNWLTLQPYNYMILGLGLFGLITTFLKHHQLHVIHGILTVFMLSFMFLTYLNDLALNAQTTGVYGLLLLGAIWLCVRLAFDHNVIVTWID